MTISPKVREALKDYAGELDALDHRGWTDQQRKERLDAAEANLLAALRASDAAATPDAVLREAVDLDVVARSCYSYVGRSLDEEPHLRIAAEVEAERKMRWLRHYVEKYAAPILTAPLAARVAELEARIENLMAEYENDTTEAELRLDNTTLRAKLAEAERERDEARAQASQDSFNCDAMWGKILGEIEARKAAEARCEALEKHFAKPHFKGAPIQGSELGALVKTPKLSTDAVMVDGAWYGELRALLSARPDAAKGEG